MNSLQTRLVIIPLRAHNNTAGCIATISGPRGRPCQGQNGFVGYVDTLHQSDSLQLWQRGQLRDRRVRQIMAASEVNVANTVAARHEPLDRLVRDVDTVAQVYVVQVLTEPRDGIDGCIRDLLALRKDEVAQSRRHIDNPLHGCICEIPARSEVEDSEVIVASAVRQRDECMVGNPLA